MHKRTVSSALQHDFYPTACYYFTIASDKGLLEKAQARKEAL